MRVTPLDIRKQEFRKTMRGLDADEVYAFLNTVADEYEIVLSDNKKLRERIVELEERLKEYKNIETNLRNTLLTAERLTAEAKENAKREASLIIREAEMEAEKAAEAIRAQTQQLRREILELKKHKDNYIARLKTWLESHKKMVDGFEEDFSVVDNDIEKVGKKVEKDVARVQQTRRMSRERITEGFNHEAKGKATWDEERKREEEQRPTVPRPEWHKKPVQHVETTPDVQGTEPEDSKTLFQDTQPAPGPSAPGNEPAGSHVPPIKTEPIGAVVDEMKPQHVERPQDETHESPESESWEERKLKEDVARSIEQKLYPEPNVEGFEGDSVKAEAHTKAAPGGEDVPGMQRPDEVPNVSGQQAVSQGEDTGGSAGGTFEDQWKKYDVRDEEPDWKSYEVPVEGDVKEDVPGEEASYAHGKHYPDEAASPGGANEEVRESSVPDEKEVEEALSGLKEITEGDESTWSMEELKKNLTNLNQNEGD